MTGKCTAEGNDVATWCDAYSSDKVVMASRLECLHAFETVQLAVFILAEWIWQRIVIRCRDRADENSARKMWTIRNTQISLEIIRRIANTKVQAQNIVYQLLQPRLTAYSIASAIRRHFCVTNCVLLSIFLLLLQKWVGSVVGLQDPCLAVKWII